MEQEAKGSKWWEGGEGWDGMEVQNARDPATEGGFEQVPKDQAQAELTQDSDYCWTYLSALPTSSFELQMTQRDPHKEGLAHSQTSVTKIVLHITNSLGKPQASG